MASFQYGVGDRVLVCSSVGVWCGSLPNGLTGTVVELARNNYGRIESVIVDWDTKSYQHVGWAGRPVLVSPLDAVPLKMAIYNFKPLTRCHSCKHKMYRMAHGLCLEKEYEMSPGCLAKRMKRNINNGNVQESTSERPD